MKNTMKRTVAFVLVLIITASCLPLFNLNASSNTVDYVYSGNYIYNWGEREEIATFLSPKALEFYTGSNTFDALSAFSGGTSTQTAPSSALYSALQKLMKDKHSYITSYDATRPLYQYTDCENSGGRISSFYSGDPIGPAWDSGSTWNREHTWPNSKGLNGSDENDIMMLRPTATSENGSRGNKAYGKSSGYYFPNTESGGEHDVRGDVARIFLYVYVRWGNTGNLAWGTSGVMESLDVLLEWMEADPVDTWELGRNDSVQSITGTRNVFVDYPELGFLLFGEEIPSDMTTPSGEANANCGHNNFGAGVVTPPSCETQGYTLYTCRTAGCSYSYKSNVQPATGHSYQGGTCSVCGEAKPAEPVKPTYVSTLTTGKAYKLGIFSTAKNAEYYFNGTMSGYYGATDTAYTNGVDVYVENATGGYYLYFMNQSNQKQYINLVISGTHYNFTYSSSASSVFTWDSAKSSLKTTVSGETCYIGTYGNYVTMGVLRQSQMEDSDYFARFYTENGDSGSACQHDYKAVVTPPTCIKGGYTTYTCTLCNDSYTQNPVNATGHSFQNGVCGVCGAPEPSADSRLLSTDSIALYRQTKTDGATNALRVIFVADQEYLYTFTELNVTIVFTTANGTKTYTGKLAPDSDDFVLYRTVTALGQAYHADTNCLLFGISIVDIPKTGVNSVSISLTDANGIVISQGSANFS